MLKVDVTVNGNAFALEGDITLDEVRAFFRAWVNAQHDDDTDAPTIDSLTDLVRVQAHRIATSVIAHTPAGT